MNFLLLFLLQSAAPISEPAEAHTYMSCVVGETQRLLPSGEAAPSIADAAVFLCQPKLNAAVRAINRASDAVVHAKGFVGTGQLSSLDRLENQLEHSAHNVAVTVVVESRLKSRTR